MKIRKKERLTNNLEKTKHTKNYHGVVRLPRSISTTIVEKMRHYLLHYPFCPLTRKKRDSEIQFAKKYIKCSTSSKISIQRKQLGKLSTIKKNWNQPHPPLAPTICNVPSAVFAESKALSLSLIWYNFQNNILIKLGSHSHKSRTNLQFQSLPIPQDNFKI